MATLSGLGFSRHTLIATAFSAALVALFTASAAQASCTPTADATDPAPGTTVTCTGTTTNQNGATAGYGTGQQADITVNIDSAATVQGTISTGYGVRISSGTVNNAGQITGRSIGVLMQSGTINNSGTISGSIHGVEFTAVNPLIDAGSLVNNVGGVISGDIAVLFSGNGSSLFNAGTITSLSAYALVATGTGNTVTLAPTSVINGIVFGSGNDTLQLGGTGTGTFDVSQIDSALQYRGFSTFNKVDASTWILTGVPGQTTGWSINGGTLSVAIDASLGTSNEPLSFNGGILQVTGTSFTSTTRTINWGANGGGFDIADPTNIFSVSQALTGTGGLAKLGAGELILSGANTYSGATTVSAGALVQGVAGGFSSSSAFSVAAGAVLDFGHFDTAIGSLAGAGNVQLGTSNLTTGGDNTSTTFSGTINGNGGLTKTGSGTLTLAGVENYTGATIVDGGTLNVTGDITASSGVTVNAGGTLSGSGLVGSLAFNSAATYLVQVTPSSASQLNVTGTATLAGATVNASFASGSYVNKQYTILTASSGLNGTFGSLVNTSLPSNFKTSLSYDANNAYLNLTLSFVAPPSSGLQPNQQGVGNALTSYFNRTGGIPLAFGGLTSSGLTQVSGETTTGSQHVSFDAATRFMGTMTDFTNAGRSGDAPTFAPPLGYADAQTRRDPRDAFAMFTKAVPKTFEPRWDVWAAGYGGSQTTNGSAASGTNTATSNVYGIVLGADYRMSPNTVAGFSLAGGGTNFSVTNGGNGHSDLFQAGAFVRHNIATSYVTASLAYGWQDVTTDRTVTLSGIDSLHAEFHANTWSGRLEGGDRYLLPYAGGIGLTPYAALQVTALALPGYSETGTSLFALDYAAKTTTNARSELGLRGDKSYALTDAVLTLRDRVAWAHDTNTDTSASATFQSLPGASFVVDGASPAHDAALTTASAELTFASGISLAATFEGEFSDVTRSYAGKGVARYTW